MVRKGLTTGRLRSRLRWVVRLITPWALEWWLHIRKLQRFERKRREEERRITPVPDPRVEDAIGFLLDRGLDEAAVRAGSITAHSLTFFSEIVAPLLPRERPVRALHIGNFVGVSLSFVTWLVRKQDARSVVVSIDPNATHRGIASPQNHVLALLARYGLLSNSLIIPGYTLEDTALEPGPLDQSGGCHPLACVGVLATLDALRPKPFDLVLIDGNHDLDYVKREYAALQKLVAPGSILVFDDVADWEGVKEVFQRVLETEHCRELGRDARLGIIAITAVGEAELEGRAPELARPSHLDSRSRPSGG